MIRRDLLILDDPGGPNPFTPPRPRSARRIACAAALFVSVTLLLFCLLDGLSYGVTVFAGTSVVSFGLLVRSGR